MYHCKIAEKKNKCSILLCVLVARRAFFFHNYVIFVVYNKNRELSTANPKIILIILKQLLDNPKILVYTMSMLWFIAKKERTEDQWTMM